MLIPVIAACVLGFTTSKTVCALGFTSSKTVAAAAVGTAAYAGSNSAFIVMEQHSGLIMEARNERAQLPMASTTKVLTAITALRHANPDEPVRIPKKAVGVEGSSIYLTEGEVLPLRDLLYGLMLRSGNDAATAIAVHVGGGNPARFMGMMNDTARRAGAYNSNFTNPHGLHSPDHFTTAYDLAMITRYAMNNPEFLKISATKTYRSVSAGGQVRIFNNKNKILHLMGGGNGVKTGFTKAAGRCLVASAKRGDVQLIAVVLNVGDMWNACIDGMERAFLKVRQNDLIFSKDLYTL